MRYSKSNFCKEKFGIVCNNEEEMNKLFTKLDEYGFGWYGGESIFDFDPIQEEDVDFPIIIISTVTYISYALLSEADVDIEIADIKDVYFI